MVILEPKKIKSVTASTFSLPQLGTSPFVRESSLWMDGVLEMAQQVLIWWPG